MLKRFIKLAAVLLTTSVVSPAMAATFHGEFWDADTFVDTLSAADAVIASGAPTATFQSTGIDYPNGAVGSIRSLRTSLSDFLGEDGASLAGIDAPNLVDSVFRFTGYLNLLDGPQTFSVISDDGFRLSFNGTEFSNRSTPRGFRPTTVVGDPGTGLTAFELIYFERAGGAGVEFTIDGVIVLPTVVPVPAALPLLLAALGGLGFLARRRREVI